ncbi:AAA family ATPase [Streptomyces sp. WAC00263]|uniref:AAA family ATPase n=1 Tax=Streptomyces sp. WAC00263 TaxID=1917422 RepID=UPI0032201DCB
MRSYSKGNRQKLCLIAGLMSRADLLLLDEPTSGLDPLMEREFRHCANEAKAAGQTVFLSSHILGEVEALCDRVAILRAGRLVEVGTLAEMRHLSALSVEATFTSAPPDLTRVPGVSGVEVEGHKVRLQVHGSVEPLLERLTAVGVAQILSREPSLEELFLAQYGAASGAPDREMGHVGCSARPAPPPDPGRPPRRPGAGLPHGPLVASRSADLGGGVRVLLVGGDERLHHQLSDAGRPGAAGRIDGVQPRHAGLVRPRAPHRHGRRVRGLARDRHPRPHRRVLGAADRAPPAAR